jgi:hypothetical protein
MKEWAVMGQPKFLNIKSSKIDKYQYINAEKDIHIIDDFFLFILSAVGKETFIVNMHN